MLRNSLRCLFVLCLSVLATVGSAPRLDAQSCTSPPSNLRAWFTLDETSGTTVTDEIASLTGTAYGALIAPGKVANGRAFSAQSSSYVRVPDNFRLDLGTADFTIDAWIKTTKEDGIIVAKRSSSNIGYLLMLYDGRLLLQMGDSSGHRNRWSPSSVYLADGNWHFVAASVNRDSSTGGRLYADGNLIFTFDPRAQSGSLSNAEPLLMAKTGQSGDSYAYFQGTIDEVEIFNRALLDSELDDIYFAGSAGKCKPTQCGNGLCETGETCTSCSTDCGSCVVCGNGLCESGESCLNCSTDCGPCSSCDFDGVCEPGESFQSCPDCRIISSCNNDGICQSGEDVESCIDCCGQPGNPFACP